MSYPRKHLMLYATALTRLCALPLVRRGDLTNFKPY